MLDEVYRNLGLVTLIIAVVFLIFFIVCYRKNTFNNISIIKARIIFSSVLLILSSAKTIIALILGKWIAIIDMYCAIMWIKIGSIKK